MSGVLTLAASVAAAAGVIAVVRYVDKRKSILTDFLSKRDDADKNTSGTVLDYEQDPATGVFRPRD